MTTLHKALEALHPREYAEVPLDDLSGFLSKTFAEAELIVNSVPVAPKPDKDAPPKPVAPATRAAEMISSQQIPPSISPAHETLRDSWGKPLKMAAKDNPADITMYKMAAKDRHGAWFARRSVHEGLSFDRWRTAMSKEFKESLRITGGPGAGSIRGIGADRLLEHKTVDGLGKMEVYELSAQFPGPTAPRDFVTCLLTTENGLTDLSAPHDGDQPVSKESPRHFMIVSIPVEHPDAPARSGLVRGSYESVEMIREVPRASNAGSAASADGSNESLPEHHNAVEWIMITRSDPGGGIPRFMVERGTPGSIVGDAVKFLEWATSYDGSADEEKDEVPEVAVDAPSLKSADSTLRIPPVSRRLSDSSTFEPSQPTDTGIIASLTTFARDSINSVIPTVAVNGETAIEDDDETLDESDTESDSGDSFLSAESHTPAPPLPPRLTTLTAPKHDISSTSSLSESAVITDANGEKDRAGARLERELVKLEARRKELDAKYARAKEREAAKAETAVSKDEKESEKIKQRLERETKKQQEKHEKEMKRLERKREQEEKKAEERRKKALDQDALTKMTRERDQARRVAEVLRLENDVWKERVSELQRENTVLVHRVGGMPGGRELLKDVREEVAASSASGASSAMSVLGSVDKQKRDSSPAASAKSAKSKESVLS